MCKRVFASQTSQDASVPFYKIGTLGNAADCYISRELFVEYKNKYSFPNTGETLITCSGTVGRCVQFDGKDSYFQDSNIVWLRPHNSPLTNDFLYRLLDAKDWSRLNTTTISRIYSKDLLSLKFRYPSAKDEQERIVSFFNALDTRIETQNKIIDALKSLKSRIKANVVGTLKLFDIAVCQSSTLALRDVKETGLYPVFGANGLCGYSDHYQFDSPGVAIIKDGAGVGRTFVITGGRYSILGTLNLLQPKGVSVNFLDLCLNGIDFRKYIVGSGIPHIYFEDYKVEKVPELNGDNELLSKLASAIEERIGIDTEVLNLFSKQKEYLLKNMFI